MIRVERLTGAAADWDPFVRSQRNWTPFHLLAWRDVISRVFGHPTIYLAARDGPALVGVLPLVLVQEHSLRAFPRLDAVRQLRRAARQRPRRFARSPRRPPSSHGPSGSNCSSCAAARELPLDLPVSHRKITVVLDIPAGEPDKLFKSFESKLRSQVRRPQKEGIEVRFGRDQLEPFYSVFARHMRDLGTPVQPKRLFTALADAFGEDLWVGAAWYQGQPVAAGVGFRWGTEFEMTWASSLYAFNKLSPNMALYWSFMERACNENLTLFNFGRCSEGVGTHRFKKQWGSRDEQLWWYQQGDGAAAHALAR